METTISSLLRIIQKDKVISPYPASLYSAILAYWQEQGSRELFRVGWSILMPLSGIRSFATYHKCLRVLVQRGYIGYEPSHNNRPGSGFALLDKINYKQTKATEAKDECRTDHQRRSKTI